MHPVESNEAEPARAVGAPPHRGRTKLATTPCDAVDACSHPAASFQRARGQGTKREEVHDRIDAELHTVGLKHFSKAIARRMELIEVLAARFNNDSRIIRRMCLTVMERIAGTRTRASVQARCGQQARHVDCRLSPRCR